jgi:hypothetical protein
MKTLIALGIAGALLAAEARACEHKISLDTAVRMTNIYEARGFLAASKASVQPVTTLVDETCIGKFTAGYWENRTKNEVTERDVMLAVNKTMKTGAGNLNATLGWNRYMTPINDQAATSVLYQELLASLSLENAWNPKLLVAHDYKDGNGQFASFGVTRNMGRVAGTVEVHYNNHYGLQRQGFSGVQTQLTLPLGCNAGTCVELDGRYFAATRSDLNNVGAVGLTVKHTFK